MAEKVVRETMDVSQGKLVIGLDVTKLEPEDKAVASVYNAILGGGANSKLFQNVREKASLAYTASSNYIRQKNSIFIRCGIEIQNYNKALETIGYSAFQNCYSLTEVTIPENVTSIGSEIFKNCTSFGSISSDLFNSFRALLFSPF